MRLPEGYATRREFLIDMALGLAFLATLFVACAIA